MFALYPKISYKINDYDYLKVVDITIYTKLKDFLEIYRTVASRPYTIMNGDPPDLVSYKIYGTPKYEYILLAFNDIRNLYDEWPRSYKVFNEYIEEKYGSINAAQTTVARYYNSSGLVISEDAWNELQDPNKNSFLQTNFEYEVELNDEKAKINIFSTELIVKFEVDLQKFMLNVRDIE